MIDLIRYLIIINIFFVILLNIFSEINADII